MMAPPASAEVRTKLDEKLPLACASIPATEGPAIWDVVESYVKRMGTVSIDPNKSVKVTGA